MCYADICVLWLFLVHIIYTRGSSVVVFCYGLLVFSFIHILDGYITSVVVIVVAWSKFKIPSMAVK